MRIYEKKILRVIIFGNDENRLRIRAWTGLERSLYTSFGR